VGHNYPVCGQNSVIWILLSDSLISFGNKTYRRKNYSSFNAIHVFNNICSGVYGGNWPWFPNKAFDEPPPWHSEIIQISASTLFGTIPPLSETKYNEGNLFQSLHAVQLPLLLLRCLDPIDLPIGCKINLAFVKDQNYSFLSSYWRTPKKVHVEYGEDKGSYFPQLPTPVVLHICFFVAHPSLYYTYLHFSISSGKDATANVGAFVRLWYKKKGWSGSFEFHGPEINWCGLVLKASSH